MPTSKQVFNYQPENVCGGSGHKPTSLGPRPQPILPPDPEHGYVGTGLIKPPAPPEGHYVTRERGTMSASDFRMLVQWRRRLVAEGRWPTEVQDVKVS